MQLLLILLMLAANGGLTDDIKPLLEEAGGGQLASALSEAQEIAEALTAVTNIAAENKSYCAKDEKAPPFGENPDVGFPFAAVASVIDDELLTAFSGYVCDN